MEQHIELKPELMGIEGQLRFYDEDLLDEYLDLVGLRVNGQDYFEFSDLSEVEFDELFRLYKVFVPYELASLGVGEELEIEAISSDPSAPLMFKPAIRTLKVEKRELHKNIGINFKIIEGMFV